MSKTNFKKGLFHYWTAKSSFYSALQGSFFYMYTKAIAMRTSRRYTLLHTFLQTSKHILIFIVWSTLVVGVYVHFNLYWLAVPWLPLALIGTAVAFYLGFKNNAAYERLAEARSSWGCIVNNSRAFSVFVRDFLPNQDYSSAVNIAESATKRLIYRHIAWLYALTFQLREPDALPHKSRRRRSIKGRLKELPKPERYDLLQQYISAEEYGFISLKQNRAVHLLSLQSKELKQLLADGQLSQATYLELLQLIEEFYRLQGESERIKGFPFPRQYASINVFFVGLFIVLLPLGMVSEFAKMGNEFIWLTVPFTVIISWVFHTMEMIGDFSENPFEGLYDDVPITSLSRQVEIDMREILDETDLPPNIKPMTEFKILF